MKQQKDRWTKIAASLAGEMDSDEHQDFLLELKNKQRLKNDYELMKKTWKNFDSNPAEKYSNTQKAWASLNTRIKMEGMLDEEQPVFRMNARSQIIRIAALVLLVLAIGIPSVYYSLGKIGPASATIEHHSKEGLTTVDLPDGSRVFLNRGASLEYEKGFEDDRHINLEGEGYFDVMADPAKPFRVNSGKVIITVLGTSFNIKESPDEDVEVYVESGKVKVEQSKTGESVMLLPGQMIRTSNDLEIMELSDDNYLSWKTKDFKFIDEPVDQILKILENAYHVEVRSEAINIEEMRLTSTYSDQSFDAILTTICTAMNLQYEKEGKVYILHTK